MHRSGVPNPRSRGPESYNSNKGKATQRRLAMAKPNTQIPQPSLRKPSHPVRSVQQSHTQQRTNKGPRISAEERKVRLAAAIAQTGRNLPQIHNRQGKRIKG